MGQMGLACGSFASRRSKGKAILVAADWVKFPGAMVVGDQLSVYVELLKQGRTSLRLKAEAIARERDGDTETLVAEGEFTFVALDEAGKPREIGDESGRRSPAHRQGAALPRHGIEMAAESDVQPFGAGRDGGPSHFASELRRGSSTPATRTCSRSIVEGAPAG